MTEEKPKHNQNDKPSEPKHNQSDKPSEYIERHTNTVRDRHDPPDSPPPGKDDKK